MTIFALAIGLFSYIIYFLGITHLLYLHIIIDVVIMYWIAFILLCVRYFGLTRIKFYASFKSLLKSRLNKLISLFLVILTVINLIGALGPEYGFDALWYHLELPKLYLQNHSIFHIPGGLLYYSDMPKLAEMLYIVVLSLGNEIGAKLLQYIFGILIIISVYKLSRKYLNSTFSLLACLMFYSNIVVDWESTTAYIDLVRSFFEVLALYNFVEWAATKNGRYFVFSAILTGLVITTKLIGLGTLGIFIALLLLQRVTVRVKIKQIITYAFISLAIPLPWFLFSLYNTGNPVYPFFTPLYPTSLSSQLLNPITLVSDIFNLFTSAADPVSPIYLMILPLVFFYRKQFSKQQLILVIYSFLAILVWYITPRTGGGRFIVPYLPALSILTAIIIDKVRNESKVVSQALIVIIVFIACISLLYRGLANGRYVPVIFGTESKSTFLSTHLNFSFGDFYDTDNYFAQHMKPTDKVLLFGFHNLYYVDFPFVDSSWIQKGDRFNYIATQNISLPDKFSLWRRIYANPLTHVTLYSIHNLWANY